MIVAIIGAESTGKSTLAADLAERVRAVAGLRCTWVPEHLRSWCDARGRTPRADEQAAIARAQAEAILAAAAAHDIVIADTTPLMTAVYSWMLFGDDTLVAGAIDFHRRCAATLLTALDLPWEPDGLQRDGEHVREPVDGHLRALLAAHGLGWSVVAGSGPTRADAALDAIAPLLAARGADLQARRAARNADPSAARWTCMRCDDPDCEHRSWRLARGGT